MGKKWRRHQRASQRLWALLTQVEPPTLRHGLIVAVAELDRAALAVKPPKEPT